MGRERLKGKKYLFLSEQLLLSFKAYRRKNLPDTCSANCSCTLYLMPVTSNFLSGSLVN